MYQEDAEFFDHQRQLVELEHDRQEGTGMVDLVTNDWVEETPEERKMTEANPDGED